MADESSIFGAVELSESIRQTVTTLLLVADTNPEAAEELLPLVYEELRRLARHQMAAESPGNTLQPTALVHEAYMRLVQNPEMEWQSRGHFFAAAARSMRQILINRAHRRRAAKRGGNFQRLELDDVTCKHELAPDRMIALDEALRRLEQIDDRKSQIVMLRYFSGLTIDETAQALELSPATVKREWQFSRTWLYREMNR